jgi:hypothetical protein
MQSPWMEGPWLQWLDDTAKWLVSVMGDAACCPPWEQLPPFVRLRLFKVASPSIAILKRNLFIDVAVLPDIYVCIRSGSIDAACPFSVCCLLLLPVSPSSSSYPVFRFKVFTSGSRVCSANASSAFHCHVSGPTYKLVRSVQDTHGE